MHRYSCVHRRVSSLWVDRLFSRQTVHTNVDDNYSIRKQIVSPKCKKKKKKKTMEISWLNCSASQLSTSILQNPQ